MLSSHYLRRRVRFVLIQVYVWAEQYAKWLILALSAMESFHPPLRFALPLLTDDAEQNV